MKALKLLIVGLLVTGNVVVARAGTESGGGGSSDLQEFISDAQAGLSLMKGAGLPEVSKYEAALEKIKVTFVDGALSYNGEIKDAVVLNPESGEIFFSKQAWRSLAPYREKRRLLVAHEVCRVAGIQDNNYEVTGVLYDAQTNFKQSHIRITAEPGSLLDEYDRDVEVLKQFYDDFEIKDKAKARQQAAAILKKYFGFAEVKFASTFLGRTAETAMAIGMAISLRQILPAWGSLNAYVGVNGKLVSGNKSNDIDTVNQDMKVILVLNDRVAGTSFDVKVHDTKANKKDGWALGRTEEFRLTVGGDRFFLTDKQLKAHVSLIQNYSSTIHSVSFDF